MGKRLLSGTIIAMAVLTVDFAPRVLAEEDLPVADVPRFLPAEPSDEASVKPAAIRFVTSDDFPPLNFLDGSGRLSGYNVELARLICTRLAIPCTIQVRPFPLLLEAVRKNEADAIVAGVADTPGLRAFLAYSQTYLRLPARFVGRKPVVAELVPETLASRTVAVVAETRHADFLRDFFPAARLIETTDEGDALRLVKDGTADAAFTGALGASFWLTGREAADCCAFASGAYTEPAYFGHGMAIAVDRDNLDLKGAIDEALRLLEQDGSLADLYLRFFPVGLY